MGHIALRVRARNQMGMTLLEVLAVVAVLAILAGAAALALGGMRDAAQVQACVSERRTVLTALSAARVTNVNGEYPAVAGADGFDRVREAGALAWGTQASYWHYATPPLDGDLSASNLERVATDVVSGADCGF